MVRAQAGILQGQALDLGLQVVRQVLKLVQAVLLSAETPSHRTLRSGSCKPCHACILLLVCPRSRPCHCMQISKQLYELRHVLLT